jgi:hypothetical protein
LLYHSSVAFLRCGVHSGDTCGRALPNTVWVCAVSKILPHQIYVTLVACHNENMSSTLDGSNDSTEVVCVWLSIDIYIAKQQLKDLFMRKLAARQLLFRDSCQPW